MHTGWAVAGTRRGIVDCWCKLFPRVKFRAGCFSQDRVSVPQNVSCVMDLLLSVVIWSPHIASAPNGIGSPTCRSRTWHWLESLGVQLADCRCCLVVKLCPTLLQLQAPLSRGFPRKEYWRGLPFPSPGDLPDPGIKPRSPALQADSLPLSHQGSPQLAESRSFISQPSERAEEWMKFLGDLAVREKEAGWVRVMGLTGETGGLVWRESEE